MENHFEIINNRLERIELLLQKLVPQTTEKKINKISAPVSKMPTEEEMDAYVMKHVFSRND